MQKNFPLFMILLVLGGVLTAQFREKEDIAGQVLALERQTMEGWLKGDPGPTIAILDPEVTYFHAPLEKRIEGVSAVKALFAPYQGKPLFDSYEISEPRTQVSERIAVLTYQLITHNGPVTARWNSTEIYQDKKEGWRIIHSHWSKVGMSSQ